MSAGMTYRNARRFLCWSQGEKEEKELQGGSEKPRAAREKHV